MKIIGVSDFQNNLYAPLEDLDEVHLTPRSRMTTCQGW